MKNSGYHPPPADIPQLTGLRALAAGMVLVLHLDQQHGHHVSSWLPVIEKGYLGVDIFFVLSGFIITHVYGTTAAVTQLQEYAKFLWYRFARLFPVHLLMIVMLILMVAARGLLDTNFWIIDAIPYQLTMMHIWYPEVTWNLPAWSISAEWHAYILFPMFAVFILRFKSLIVSGALVLALMVAFQWIVVEDTGLSRSFIGLPAILRIFAEFALGVFLYRLTKNHKPSVFFDVLAALTFCVAMFVPDVAPVAQVVLIGIFVASLALSAGLVKATLSGRYFVFLGGASYAIYMIHFPIIKIIQNINYFFGLGSPSVFEGVMLVIFWSILIVVISSCVYFYFERPAQKWLRCQWKFT